MKIVLNCHIRYCWCATIDQPQDAKQAAGNYTVYCETFSSQSFRLHPAAILLFILLLTPL
ncbi:unnamed protein product [Nezara viridula]|uniref:Uncharacterized protein n=1 Tax=Nezara viridula TaxID=85310 RepID=A0A9P0HT69_NEZVI|nr:unnamed protein product [Nezara viridula]